MNTITLIDIEVPIRDTPVPVDPATPFLITEQGCPLWFEDYQMPSDNSETGKLLARMLLNTMVFGKPISIHQTLDNYRELPMARANMIGLYEQLFAQRRNGVFADIPPGDDGQVYLLKSGNLYSVFADSVGAAKRFCVWVMYVLNYKLMGEREGFGDAYNEAMEKLLLLK